MANKRLKSLLFFGILLASITAPFQAKAEEDVTKPFSGSVSLGGNKTGGNTDTASLTGKLSLQHKSNSKRFSLNAKTVYGESDGVKNQEESELGLRAELLRGKYFPFWDFSYYRNPFRSYDYRIATGPGLGYYFIHSEKTYLTGSYYVIYNRDRLTQGAEKEKSFYIQNIEERFRYKFDFETDVKLKQKLIYKLTSKEANDYYIDFIISLETSLDQDLSIELEYSSKYQNLPVSAGIEKQDTNISALIKHTF